LGLMYCTEGGLTMIDLIDYFGSNFIIYVMGGLEAAAISWVYGLENFCDDIEFMLKKPVGWYFKICWAFVTPIGLAAIFIYAMVTQELNYPDAHLISGWLLAALALVLVPALALHTILTRQILILPNTIYYQYSILLHGLKAALKPEMEWGPVDPVIRKEWEADKAQRARMQRGGIFKRS